MVSCRRQAHWLAMALTAVILVGCVTTEQRPDGRTTVRFSPNAVSGSSSTDGSPDPVPNPPASLTTTPARKFVAPAIGTTQRRDIERGLSCQMTSTLDASLNAAGIPVTGDPAPAPKGLSVFGLPVTKVAFNRESGVVSHTAYFGAGVSLQKVAAAAKLKGSKGIYSRQVAVEDGVVGLLTANIQNGNTVLQCVIDSEMDIE